MKDNRKPSKNAKNELAREAKNELARDWLYQVEKKAGELRRAMQVPVTFEGEVSRTMALYGVVLAPDAKEMVTEAIGVLMKLRLHAEEIEEMNAEDHALLLEELDTALARRRAELRYFARVDGGTTPRREAQKAER